MTIDINKLVYKKFQSIHVLNYIIRKEMGEKDERRNNVSFQKYAKLYIKPLLKQAVHIQLLEMYPGCDKSNQSCGN